MAGHPYPSVPTASTFSDAKGLAMQGIRAQAMQNYPKGKKAKAKIASTMHEWKQGTLHSGSKTGPKVTSQSQAVAIALSKARKGG